MGYPRLFAPGKIGTLEVRNRVVLPSMTTRLAECDGTVTPELVAYYRERARGGAGLVMVEMASPQPRGRHRRRELGISSDHYIDGLRSLANSIRKHGAKAGIQLGHGGARALPTELGNLPLAAMAGPVPIFEGGAYVNYPELFDDRSLETLIVDHVAAARRAEAAGFDMVELHGAHGYLLTQLSHEDENQVLPNADARNHYLAELARRVVEAVDIPVTYRINGQDYYKAGHSIADSIELIKHLVGGGVSAISVSGGHYSSDDPEIMIPPMPYPDGVFLEDAAAIKSAFPVPVIAAGRLNNASIAEEALVGGMIDFVAIGRGQIADPHWARKMQQGERVRECIACNHCVRTMRSGGSLACAVNPVVTTADRPSPAPVRERRLVFGAGPAGLTYALESSRAGHEVCLVARSNEWRAVSSPTFNGYLPDRTRMRRYFHGLWAECLAAGVVIVAESAMDPQWAARADLIVDARGAMYARSLGGVTGLAEQLLPFVRGRAARAASRRLHHAFLYRLRRGRDSTDLSTGNREVVQVGDAAAPGDLAAAVNSAYVEAWKETHAA